MGSEKSFPIVLKGQLFGLRQFLAAENHLKVMKHAFNFMLKTLFVLRMLKFFPDFLVIQEKGLIRGLRLISKFLTSLAGIQIISTHALPNISRLNDNQAMKFDQ